TICFPRINGDAVMKNSRMGRILIADEQRGIVEALRLLLGCEGIAAVPVTLAGRRGIAAQRRGLLGSSRLKRHVHDGMDFHLVKQVEDNFNTDMNPGKERSSSLRSFGRARR